MCNKICLDFDDVLYNLTKINIEYIQNKYNIKLDPLSIDRFSYYIDEGYESIIENVWNNKDYYITSDLYENAKDFYDELVKNYGIENIKIVTTSLPLIIENKDKMIRDRFNIDCEIIHTKEKHLYTQNSILVDDSPNNIIKHIENNNVPGIILDLGYGWNKSLKEDNNLIYRANSYSETLKIIDNLLKKDLNLDML